MFKIESGLKSQSGIAALLTVVIISAAVLIMARSASLSGINEIEIAYLSSESGEALAIAEGCAEETLRRLQIDSSYTASDVILSVGNGSCTINIAANGDERTITVLGNVRDYYKKIEVNTSLGSGQITIDNLREISN